MASPSGSLVRELRAVRNAAPGSALPAADRVVQSMLALVWQIRVSPVRLASCARVMKAVTNRGR